MKWENLINQTTVRKVHKKQPEAWFIKKKKKQYGKNKSKCIKVYRHNHIKVIIILKDYILPLKGEDSD